VRGSIYTSGGADSFYAMIRATLIRVSIFDNATGIQYDLTTIDMVNGLQPT
jgi:hypothetical protein